MGIEIRSYTANEKGKDLVVGDIHGEFKKLKTILENLNFDTTKDRLFSVGDLCDRGPNSEELLQWLNYSWFIPVMGNHELMIVNHFYGFLDEEYMRRLKADWFLSLKKADKEKIVHYFNNLPVGIEITTKDKKVGIVHAMCPVDSWDFFKKSLNGLQKQEMASEAMWSFISEKKIKYVNDIDAIVVGHNIVPDFCIKENTYMLDTGSGYRTGRLTILDLENMKPIWSK